ncbi:hypothetical protein LDENG_00143390 [Lucifuga dentata]|nr:hypothetical protein LDENG_00143390 [Lucifuga dentata]
MAALQRLMLKTRLARCSHSSTTLCTNIRPFPLILSFPALLNLNLSARLPHSDPRTHTQPPQEVRSSSNNLEEEQQEINQVPQHHTIE